MNRQAREGMAMAWYHWRVLWMCWYDPDHRGPCQHDGCREWHARCYQFIA